jgi:hypothetical protein
VVIRVYISSDPADRALAEIISQLLKRVFTEVDVFVPDHAIAFGGPRLQETAERLKSAHAVVSLITPRSKNDLWLLFEAGAGLKLGRTLPLLAGEVKPEQVPAPLELFEMRWFTRKGLSRLLEDVANLARVNLPPTRGGGAGARAPALAPHSPTTVRRRAPTGAHPTSPVREKVGELIERTHRALVQLVINAMSPQSVPAKEDLDGMLLHQLREVADYLNVTYPTFLLYTLSSLQTSRIEGDDASWSLFNEEGQLERLERSVAQLEQAAEE